MRHPDVVELYDVLESEGMPFLVLELLAGETLGSRLRAKGALSPAETAAILLPVFDAVEAAHAAGIVHGDLEPENIFIAKDGDALRVRVLDFGVAKRSEKLSAAEQPLGERDVDERADLWSLGIILYECLSGKRPIEAATLGGVLELLVTESIVHLGELVPGLDPHLADEVMELLRSNRDERATSLRALRTSLEAQNPANAVLDLPEIEPPRSSRRPAAARPQRWWPWAAGAASIGVFAAAIRFGGSGESRAPAAPSIAEAPSALPAVIASAASTPSAAPIPPATPNASASARAKPPRPTVAASMRTLASAAAPPPTPPSPTAAPSDSVSRGPSGLVSDNPFLK